mmetsp:Transcript_961/g.117  ORF Transcript_961/g.117 Transcript_961/m.117 type:complete len:102 (-) Transcript_961:385-690(-)
MPLCDIIKKIILNIEKVTVQRVKLILDHFMRELELIPIGIPSPYLPKLSKQYQFTLVLDLDETLVHYAETETEASMLVRPWCYEFLEEASKYFELVIFTAA